MAKPVKITKTKMLKDLQTVLYSVMEQFNRIYGGRAVIALVDRQSSNEVIRFDGRAEEYASALDIGEMEVTNYMAMIYDYAIDGRLDKQLSNDWEIVIEDVVGFFDGLKDFPLIEGNADTFPLETISHILGILHARFALDFGIWVTGEDLGVAEGYLQLTDVALLAGIDEKTARNLAHPAAKNRLVTEKWEGRTLVEKGFAREWLIQRGYNDTIEFDSTLERDLEKRGFWSLVDLGEYVQGHRQKFSLTTEALGATAGFESEGNAWLQQVEAGHATFDRVRLQAIATALRLPPKAFVLAVLKAIQSDQLRELEAQLLS